MDFLLAYSLISAYRLGLHIWTLDLWFTRRVSRNSWLTCGRVGLRLDHPRLHLVWLCNLEVKDCSWLTHLRKTVLPLWHGQHGIRSKRICGKAWRKGYRDQKPGEPQPNPRWRSLEAWSSWASWVESSSERLQLDLEERYLMSLPVKAQERWEVRSSSTFSWTHLPLNTKSERSSS